MKPLFFDAIDDVALLRAVRPSGKHNLAIIKNRARIADEYVRYRGVLRQPIRHEPPVDKQLKEA
jgi:hypothetical protein